jgi:hypothetical protein
MHFMQHPLDQMMIGEGFMHRNSQIILPYTSYLLLKISLNMQLAYEVLEVNNL